MWLVSHFVWEEAAWGKIREVGKWSDDWFVRVLSGGFTVQVCWAINQLWCTPRTTLPLYAICKAVQSNWFLNQEPSSSQRLNPPLLHQPPVFAVNQTINDKTVYYWWPKSDCKTKWVTKNKIESDRRSDWLNVIKWHRIDAVKCLWQIILGLRLFYSQSRMDYIPRTKHIFTTKNEHWHPKFNNAHTQPLK